jgi:hypothetical protein
MITGAQSRRRSAFTRGLAGSVPSPLIKPELVMAGSIAKINAASLRASENVATWKTYLPEACVAAMINDGWHWST